MKKYIILFLIVAAGLSSSYIIKSAKKDVVLTDSIESQPTPAVPEATTPYKLSEVKKHNKETDCWVAIMGSVYDMTRFIDQHPGRKAIVQGCGKDASALFNAEDSHTPIRRQLMQGYKIGILVEDK